MRTLASIYTICNCKWNFDRTSLPCKSRVSYNEYSAIVYDFATVPCDARHGYGINEHGPTGPVRVNAKCTHSKRKNFTRRHNDASFPGHFRFLSRVHSNKDGTILYGVVGWNRGAAWSSTLRQPWNTSVDEDSRRDRPRFPAGNRSQRISVPLYRPRVSSREDSLTLRNEFFNFSNMHTGTVRNLYSDFDYPFQRKFDLKKISQNHSSWFSNKVTKFPQL